MELILATLLMTHLTIMSVTLYLHRSQSHQGVELHSNHHSGIFRPKFSQKWRGFDIGWMYITGLEFLGLAKLKS